ncbi:MAG: cereblon family protein [Desulfobacterium sp.]|nr:cereblon family protein [Desulfobacterium sp.]
MLLFKETQSDCGVATGVLGKNERESEEKKAVLCRFCYSIITHTDNLMAVNGSHSHIFANPHGHVYEIGCYKRASGCLAIFEPSAEFSWFNGYHWQVTICKTCSNHLGWYFQSNASSFFGLIQKDLIIFQ